MAQIAYATVTFLVCLTREDMTLESNTSDENFKIAIEKFMKEDFDYNNWKLIDIEIEVCDK